MLGVAGHQDNPIDATHWGDAGRRAAEGRQPRSPSVEDGRAAGGRRVARPYATSRRTCRAATSCSHRKGRAGPATGRGDQRGGRRAGRPRRQRAHPHGSADGAVVRPTRTRVDDPTKVVVTFLGAKADARRRQALDLDDFAPEALTVHGTEVYLHLPGGQARSKLARRPGQAEDPRRRLGHHPQLAHRPGPGRHDALSRLVRSEDSARSAVSRSGERPAAGGRRST